MMNIGFHSLNKFCAHSYQKNDEDNFPFSLPIPIQLSIHLSSDLSVKMTTYVYINLTTSLLSQLILRVKHKVWKKSFIIKKNINQLKVKKMTHIGKLKEKLCKQISLNKDYLPGLPNLISKTRSSSPKNQKVFIEL